MSKRREGGKGAKETEQPRRKQAETAAQEKRKGREQERDMIGQEVDSQGTGRGQARRDVGNGVSMIKYRNGLIQAIQVFNVQSRQEIQHRV